MNKPNYKEWSVNFNETKIKVTNWWSWSFKSSADLYANGEHLDNSTKVMANPNNLILSKYDYSKDIKSIEVYGAGIFKVKMSMMVNGEIVFQDELNFFERLVNKLFPKK